MVAYIGVDVGGTFTDFAVTLPDAGREIFHKVPSTPGEPDRAIIEGLRQILARGDVGPDAVVRLAHGTTVGTNALIQRRVGKVAMVTTAGFRDLLEIGRQTRPKVYDIHLDHPRPLVPRELRFEVPERMRADGKVHVRLDEPALRTIAARLLALKVDCVAVCFLHAHAFPRHEARAAAILRRALGRGVAVITSAEIYPEFREYERFSTTVLNGALLTVMDAYLDRFGQAVRGLGIGCSPTISQSGGGLMSIKMARSHPIRTALSGPAAGAIGAAHRARRAGFPDVVTLDVGGTSADVALLLGGETALVHSRTLAGFPLRLPALDVNSVGAGGGSIAHIDAGGLLKVGPRSAGAHPGPVCYGLGNEEPTVTDANVTLQTLNPTHLLGGRMKIDQSRAQAAIARLAARLGLDPMATAQGILSVVTANMAKAIRVISVQRGHDPRDYTLVAFGGAGPLHAARLARELDMKRILVPRNPGILCALGLLLSDLQTNYAQTHICLVAPDMLGRMRAIFADLRDRAETWFDREGIPAGGRRVQATVDMRYAGQNYELPVAFPADADDGALLAALREGFERAHRQMYGYVAEEEPMQAVTFRLEAIGAVPKADIAARPPAPGTAADAIIGTRDVWLVEAKGFVACPIYDRERLGPGHRFVGPAIIEQMDATTVLLPGQTASVDSILNILVEG